MRINSQQSGQLFPKRLFTQQFKPNNKYKERTDVETSQKSDTGH